jgi:dUTP pyrophosphatase
MKRDRRVRPVLKLLRLHKDATLPSYSHDDDAGFDISVVVSGTIRKGEKKTFPTGIASEIPWGWFVSVRDRSGLSVNQGLHVLAGVIDAGYRGEWQITIINLGPKAYKVQKGERIAQGILQPAPQAKIVEVNKLSETKRGKKGFGSTGRK